MAGCGGCGKIIHGAAGLAKAGLQTLGVPIDQVSMSVLAYRREMCRGCDFATRNEKRVHLPTKGLTSLSVCRKCDCNIKAKTMLASEHCPEGKW